MTVTDKSWTCDIKYDGCKTDAVVSWVCQVEGIQISGCRPCYDAWKEKRRQDPSLENRCPKCAPVPIRVKDGRKPAKIKPHTAPLNGVIAEALDAAMFHEGVLVDVRRKVLLRLATDDPWLAVSFVDQRPAS